MFKRVDGEEVEIKLEGFVYSDKNGNDEYVNTGPVMVNITNSGGDEARFYNQDLPKLIKALQAAYDHYVQEQ